MGDVGIDRRDALRRLVVWGSAALLPAAAVGCKNNKGGGCSDVSGLSEPDKTVRTSLEYNEVGPDPNKVCDNCLQFRPAPSGPCGACTAVKGPIAPKGTCKAWAMKV